MYGKIFASTFTGSMMGAGAVVFAVWSYVIANVVNSTVELNPKLLAAILGITEQEARGAIDYLCAPDPNSRSKNDEGRRLVREGEYSYHVPNHTAYRIIRNEDERREYNRVKQAELRDKKRDKPKRQYVKAPVNDTNRLSNVSANAVYRSRSKKQKQTTSGEQPGVERETWLSPYVGLWEGKFGTGSAKSLAGRLAAALKPLHDAHGPELVAERLSAYLAQAEPRFASPQHFAQKFAGWGAKPNAGDKVRSDLLAFVERAEATNG